MNNLKHYRKQAGLTQQQLAVAVNISPRTLQDYEQGSKPLEKAAAITVLKMARVLGCTVEELIEKDPAERITGYEVRAAEPIKNMDCDYWLRDTIKETESLYEALKLAEQLAKDGFYDVAIYFLQ